MKLRSAAVLLLGGGAALAGCATKGQVRLLQAEIQTFRVESARRDSIRAAALAAMLTMQDRIMDSLGAARQSLATLDAKIQADLTDVQRQLLQVQELTGQSQARLTELKAQLDARAEQSSAAGRSPAVPGDTTARPAGPSADQIYDNARRQHTRGANATARTSYQQFLQLYPTEPRAPDALYYIAETFGSQADSAAAYYTQVVGQFPRSSRASAALLRLGRLAENRGDGAAARTYYERLTRDYPRSDDADLARERLRNLRP
jgi:tol-pal system protein YbgF